MATFLAASRVASVRLRNALPAANCLRFSSAGPSCVTSRRSTQPQRERSKPTRNEMRREGERERDRDISERPADTHGHVLEPATAPGKWVDFSLSGHQIVCHWAGNDYKCVDYFNPVDGWCHDCQQPPIPSTRSKLLDPHLLILPPKLNEGLKCTGKKGRQGKGGEE